MQGINPFKNLGRLIHVDVKYYNKEHRRLFNEAGKYPQSVVDMLNDFNMPKNKFDLEVGEFLISYLFYLKKSNPTIYTSRQSLSEEIQRAAYELESHLGYSNNNLHIWPGVNVMPVDITEKMGESVGLCVVSHINEVTHADWTPIPIYNVKACDYYLGYTNHGAIQVETKGAIVNDRNYKETNVSQAKKSIISKKKQTRSVPLTNFPCDYLYGTITCLDPDATRKVKCWILDPESNHINYDLKKNNFFTRLVNYLNVFEIVSPDSKITHRLRNVINEININFEESHLENLPMLTEKGSENFARAAKQFFYRKSEVDNLSKDKGVWGVIDENTLYFIGVKEDLVQTIVKQDVNEILNYSRKTITEEVTVNCKVLTQADVGQFWALSQEEVSVNAGISFEARGTIFTSSHGMIFGILTPMIQNFKK